MSISSSIVRTSSPRSRASGSAVSRQRSSELAYRADRRIGASRSTSAVACSRPRSERWIPGAWPVSRLPVVSVSPWRMSNRRGTSEGYRRLRGGPGGSSPERSEDQAAASPRRKRPAPGGTLTIGDWGSGGQQPRAKRGEEDSGLGQRQPDDERGTRAQDASHPHRPAVRFGDMPDDREPQAGPTGGPGTRGVRPV